MKLLYTFTGHPQLDDVLKNDLMASAFPELEGLEPGDIVVLSQLTNVKNIWNTRRADPTSLFLRFVWELRNKEVRIIIWLGVDTPKRIISSLVTFGVYDLLIDSNLDLEGLNNIIENSRPFSEVSHYLEEPPLLDGRSFALDESENPLTVPTAQPEQRPHFEMPMNNGDAYEAPRHSSDVNPMENVFGESAPKTSFLNDNQVHDSLRLVLNEEKEHEVVAQAQSDTIVLTVWGPKAGVGQSTIAHAMALYLANLNKQVLLLETDLHVPSLAYKMGLSHAEKNLENLMKMFKEEGKIPTHAFPNTQEAAKNMPPHMRKIANKVRTLPNSLHFMGLSGYTAQENIISLDDPSFLPGLITEAKYSGMDVVIIDVASPLNLLWTADSLKLADAVIGVVDSSLETSLLYQHKKTTLEKLDINVGLRVANFMRPGVDETMLENCLGDTVDVVVEDLPDLPLYSFSMEAHEHPLMQQAASEIIEQLFGIPAPDKKQVKRKALLAQPNYEDDEEDEVDERPVRVKNNKKLQAQQKPKKSSSNKKTVNVKPVHLLYSAAALLAVALIYQRIISPALHH